MCFDFTEGMYYTFKKINEYLDFSESAMRLAFEGVMPNKTWIYGDARFFQFSTSVQIEKALGMIERYTIKEYGKMCWVSHIRQRGGKTVLVVAITI
jgi:hypothetical protein